MCTRVCMYVIGMCDTRQSALSYTILNGKKSNNSVTPFRLCFFYISHHNPEPVDDTDRVDRFTHLIFFMSIDLKIKKNMRTTDHTHPFFDIIVMIR